MSKRPMDWDDHQTASKRGPPVVAPFVSGLSPVAGCARSTPSRRRPDTGQIEGEGNAS